MRFLGLLISVGFYLACVVISKFYSKRPYDACGDNSEYEP